MKQQSPLDMTQLEIQNLRLHQIAGAPSSPVKGQVWYDTTADAFMVRGASANVDLRARANHTGTQLSATISDLATTVKAYTLDTFGAPVAAVSMNAQKLTNLAAPTVGTDAVNKTYADAITTSIPTYRLDQFAAPTASVTFNNQKITNLATPTLATDACTKGYTDTAISTLQTSIPTYRLDQFAAPTAAVSLNSQKITNLATPTAAADACTKQYADNLLTGVTSYRLDQFAAPTSAVSMGGQRVTNVATPTTSTDAANKAYVDNAIAGLDWKPNVRVASTANVASLSGQQTIDGVTVGGASDTTSRVLLKNQTDPTQNGIWQVQGTGAWIRPADAAQGTLTAEAAVFVGSEGTTNKNSQWQLSTNDTITVGTTALTWIQFGASTTYVGDGTTINVTGNVISAITSSIVRKFSQAIGDGSSTALAVTHNLGSTDVVINVYEVATGAEIGCDKTRTSANVVTLGFAVAPTAGQYKAVIHV